MPLLRGAAPVTRRAPSGSRSGPDGKRAIFPVLLVLALAVAAHVPACIQHREDPFALTLVSDALSYDLWARRIVERGLAAEPVFHQAPLFPVLLSWIRDLAPGEDRTAVITVQTLLTSLAVALLVPIGRLYLGSTAAGLAGALLALLHAPFVFYSLKVLPLPLALATQAAALLFLGAARERASPALGALAGLTLGLAALARSEMLLFAPLAAVALLRPPGGGSRPLRSAPAAAFLAGILAGIAPATWHNLRQGDRVWIASSGGENLFIGNKRGARGDYTPLHPRAGDLFSERILAREVAETEAGKPLRPSEVSAFWRARAFHEIRLDPPGWLRLELRKLQRILHPGDLTDIYSLPLERSLYLTWLRALPLPSWVLLSAGLAGIASALRRRWRESWPLGALVGVHLAVLLAFFVNTRLRLPLLFAIAPFGGYALVEGARRWREGMSRPAIAAGAVLLLAIGIAGAWWTRAAPRDYVRLASVPSTQDRLEEALRVLEPVLTGKSPYGLALDEAGWVLQKKDDFAAARDHYRRALGAGLPPGRDVQTRTRLAMVLERLGDLEGAAGQHDLAAASEGASAGTYYERGMFRLRRGDREAAIRDLREATRLDPAWPLPRAALAGLEVPGSSVPSGTPPPVPSGTNPE